MSGDFRGRNRLATKFARALVVMAIASVLVVWIGLAAMFLRAQVRSVAMVQEASARHVATLVADYVGEARRQLGIFTRIEGLDRKDVAGTQAALGLLLLNAEPTFSELVTLSPQGIESAKVSRFHTYLPEELVDLSSSGAFIAAHEGRVYLSDIYVSPEGGLLSVSLALPLQGGRALVAELNVTELWRDIAKTRIGETGYAYLVDSRGRFIAYQEPSTILERYGEDMSKLPPVSRFLMSAAAKGEAGTSLDRYRGLSGVEVYGLHVPVEGSDWAVVVELPVREALADLMEMQLYVIVIGIVAAVACGLAGAVAARRLARPTASLIEAARRLEAGDMGDVPLDLERDDELGILAHAFRAMQDSLRARTVQLERSERKFRAVFDQTFELLGILDPEGRLLEANAIALDLVGTSREEVLGRYFWETPWWRASREQAEVVHEAVERTARGSFERFETYHEDRLGRPFHVDFSIKPVRDDEGEVVLLVAEGRDITGRKEAEEDVRASLREKEVLLREIHHRVKNNLQIIMSLLNLQATRIEDPEIVSLYEESIGRVRTMAQVHELLYQSPSLSSIDLSEQLRLIANDLYNAYRQTFGDVGLSVETEHVELAIEQALPCGLIVNEALTNAFKYAFPPDRCGQGLVSIRLRQVESAVELEIADDGVGIPAGIDFDRSEGIGLSLIRLLVDQLKGSVELDTSSGTRYLIRIPQAAKTES